MILNSPQSLFHHDDIHFKIRTAKWTFFFLLKPLLNALLMEYVSYISSLFIFGAVKHL